MWKKTKGINALAPYKSTLSVRYLGKTPRALGSSKLALQRIDMRNAKGKNGVGNGKESVYY